MSTFQHLRTRDRSFIRRHKKTAPVELGAACWPSACGNWSGTDYFTHTVQYDASYGGIRACWTRINNDFRIEIVLSEDKGTTEISSPWPRTAGRRKKSPRSWITWLRWSAPTRSSRRRRAVWLMLCSRLFLFFLLLFVFFRVKRKTGRRAVHGIFRFWRTELLDFWHSRA